MSNIFTFIIVISILHFAFACSLQNDQPPEYVKIAHCITENAAKKLLKEKNLCLVGTGGQMMHDIQMMYMGFYCFRELNLNEARELVLYVIDEYLSAINNNEKIRPFLHEYPFTPKNVEISIWFFKPNKEQPDLDQIYYTSAIDGVLTYYLDLPEKYSRRAICKESYDEAVKAIQTNDKN